MSFQYIGADRDDQAENPDYDETAQVVLHITIAAESSNQVETDYTVKEWNALTEEQRRNHATELWLDQVNNADKGGMKVVTPGAKEA